MSGLDDYLRFRSAIADMLDTRFHTIKWLDGEVQSGRARIWATPNAAILATTKAYPTGAKELHGLVAVGDLADIVALIPQAEAWGRREGCIIAVIASRAGWVRTLSRDGWEPHEYTLRKDL
jgi:hypothetical protein